jgi:hypothetical protein
MSTPNHRARTIFWLLTRNVLLTTSCQPVKKKQIFLSPRRKAAKAQEYLKLRLSWRLGAWARNKFLIMQPCCRPQAALNRDEGR